MPYKRTLRRLLIVCLALLPALLAFSAHAQDDWEEDFKSAPPPGKRAFASTCAGCHGLDGRGSERAPNIATSAKVQHASDSEIAKIISDGVPGTGMPAFHTLTPTQVRALVSYVRLLEGKQDARKLPGDSANGKNIFFGKGECSSCHSVSGQGGFLGPDLTSYGSGLSPSEIQKAIVDPRRIVPTGYRAAEVTTGDGTKVEGVVRNEDNFSLQLLTKDGAFHFFEKSDLQTVHYLEQSLMPVDYGKRLDQKEVNDVISFLMRASASSNSNNKTKAGE
jgi:cytochrome c oxidase cbb3-type subunit III